MGLNTFLDCIFRINYQRDHRRSTAVALCHVRVHVQAFSSKFPNNSGHLVCMGRHGRNKGETDDKQAKITSGRRKSKNSIKKPTTEVGL